MLRFAACLFLSTAWVLSGVAQDAPPVGGPYEADENTVLLLHFDDDLTNASEASADAEGHGSYSFLDNSALGLGQTIYLDNDTEGDSSYVSVPDTAALDLTGSWTIEGWVNVFTYGETLEDHNTVPRFIMKPGNETFWLPNYFIELWGTDLHFSAGYRESVGDGSWPQVNTPSFFSEAGQWYHISFIRDAEQHVLVMMMHNAERERIFFDWSSYDPIEQDPPVITETPMHIGWGGCSATGGSCAGNAWLDGAVDEIRISNVVRDFNVPPVLVAEPIANQPNTAPSYEVSLDALKIGGGAVSDVTLHYDAGSGFEEVALSDAGSGTWTGTIPGQPAGTEIQYFFSGTDEGGMTSTAPADTSGGNFYSFAVYPVDSKTLELAFENGSDVPVDESDFEHEVTIVGEGLGYSNETILGDFALQYSEDDSSFVEIDSPLLASDELTVELWFRADTMKNGNRLVAKEGGTTGPWYQQNYEIKFLAGNRIAAGSYFPSGGTPDNQYIIEELFLEDSLHTDTWYQARYILTDDTAHFEVRNDQGTVVDAKTLAVTGDPVLADGPFRLGFAGSVSSQQFFEGLIDGVKVYNYARPFVPAESGGTAVDGLESVPARVTLQQNYPNPFNPSTTIIYALPRPGEVKLAVYDVLGREVRTLVEGALPAGAHTATFDASDLASGIYFYRLDAGETSRVRRMVLLK